MLLADPNVSHETLVALANGMQPLPLAPATPTPPDASSAQTMILDLSFADARHGWLLWTSCLPNGDCQENIRVTTDGGVTWPRTLSAPAKGIAQLRFVSSQDGFALGQTAFWATHDGGATWADESDLGRVWQVEPVGAQLFAVAPSSGSPDSGIGVARLLVSSDMGVTWADAKNQPQFYGGGQLARSDATHAWLLASWEGSGEYEGLFAATRDGGKSWQTLDDPCAHYGNARLAATTGEVWLLCLGQPGAGQTDQDKILYALQMAGST